MTYKPKLPIQPDNFNVGVTNTTKVVTAAGGILTLNLQETNYAIINASSAFQINTPTGGYGSCNLLVDVSSGPITLTLGTNVYTTSSSLSLANGPHILKIAKFSDTETIVTLIYTPITNILAVARTGTVYRQFDLDTGELIYESPFISQWVNGDRWEFSPDKKYIIDSGGYVHLAADKTYLNRLTGADSTRDLVCFSSDNKYVITWGGTTGNVYEINTGTADTWPIVYSHSKLVEAACFCHSNTRLLGGHPGSGSSGKYFNTLFNTSDPDPANWVPIAGGLSDDGGSSYNTRLRLSPNGTYIAASYTGTLYGTPPNNWLQLWDITNPNYFVHTVPPSFVGVPNDATDVDWSPDGSMLACTHNGSPFFTVYETTGWTKLVSVSAPPNPIPYSIPYSCTFSADGSLLILGIYVTDTIEPISNSLLFYDTTTWEEVSILVSPYTAPIQSVRLISRNYV